jgi:hypothetical protein
MADADTPEALARRFAQLRATVDALPAQWPSDPVKRNSRTTLDRILKILNGAEADQAHGS